MAEEGKKRDAKSLVQSILAGKPAASAASVPEKTADASGSATAAGANAPDASQPAAASSTSPLPGQQSAAPKKAAAQVASLAQQLARGDGSKSPAPASVAPQVSSPEATAPMLPTETDTQASSAAAASGGPKAASQVANLLSKLTGSGSPAPQAATSPAADAPPSPANTNLEAEAQDLIDVYFELEDPEERDILFDRLAQIHIPLVDSFFLTMMEADEDEYTRVLAAGALARRGVQAGVQYLEVQLEDPVEPFFFEQAVEVLGQVRGSAFYNTLAAIWQDENRDDDQRLEAMVGMETVDLPRALTDFATMIDTLTDIKNMPDDQVEQAIMAFVRSGITAAVPNLEELRKRILAADIDPSEKNELSDFILSGIHLLQAGEGRAE